MPKTIMLNSVRVMLLLAHASCVGFDFGHEEVIVDQLLHDDIIKVELLSRELERQGKIVKTKRDLFFVLFKHGLKAVFKPLSKNGICAEVAAYKASQVMGFAFVPPTVIRKIHDKIGSLQLFVHTNLDPLVSGSFEYALEHADPDELANLKIFYYVFGQWGNGPRNILINSKNGQVQFIAIDNEAIWHRKYWRYGDNAFIQRRWKDIHVPKIDVETFPYDNYCTIKKPTPAVIKEKLGPVVPSNYVHWFCELDPFNYAYYKGSLWVQLKGNAPCFAYTTHFPQETIAKLKQIDKSMLDHIFFHAKEADFLTQEFLDSILDRRNQVLACYESKKVN